MNKPHYTKKDFIGYHDKNKRLVLPKEEDSEEDAMIYDKHATTCFVGTPPQYYFSDPFDINLHKNDYERMTDEIYKTIKPIFHKIHNAGYVARFITGGRQGFEQLAFQAVEHLKEQYDGIENVVYIPFANQDNRWPETGLFSQTEYQNMLEKADTVYNCNPQIDVETASIWDLSKAYRICKHMMIDASSNIIGQYTTNAWRKPYLKGGTEESLRYAKQKHLKMIVKNFIPQHTN